MVNWERVWLRTFTPFTQWIALAVNVFWLLLMLASLAGLVGVLITKRPTSHLDDLYRKGIQNVPFAGCYYDWNAKVDKTACDTMNDGPNTMMRRLRPMFPKKIDEKDNSKTPGRSSYWCTVDLMIEEQPCGSFNGKNMMMPEPKLESVEECYGVHSRMTHFQRDHTVRALTANLTQALGKTLHISQFYVECPLCRVSSDKGTWGSPDSNCFRNIITYEDGWPNNYRKCQHSTPDGCNGKEDVIDWKITPH